MAVDGVEDPGEAETQDSSQEEHAEDHLLLQWGHKVNIGPEHVDHPQDQEEQETWEAREKAASRGRRCM